jgi:broad specificity phosphatase PhoE
MGNSMHYFTQPKSKEKLFYFIALGLGFTSVVVLFKPITRRIAKSLRDNLYEEKVKNRPKRIILVRHGESLANVDCQVYHTTPDNKIPLSEKGRKQSLDAGLYIKSIIGANETLKFYVSPFQRTRETADYLKQAFSEKKCKVIEDPRLREQEWGNFQTSEETSQCVKMRDSIGKFYYRFPTGESGSDVYDRATLFLSSLFRDIDCEGNHIKKHLNYDNIVIVTHGLFLRLFLMRYYKMKVEEFEQLKNPGNAGVIILEKDNRGKYILKNPLSKNQKGI